jgi:hypothetical protein
MVQLFFDFRPMVRTNDDKRALGWNAQPDTIQCATQHGTFADDRGKLLETAAAADLFQKAPHPGSFSAGQYDCPDIAVVHKNSSQFR